MPVLPDFGRSFCTFRTLVHQTDDAAEQGVPANVCRAQVLARLTISRRGGQGVAASAAAAAADDDSGSSTENTYYLCQPCIGEFMYKHNLPPGEAFQFQQPTSEIWCTVQESGPSGQEKTFADHGSGRDVIQFSSPSPSSRIQNFAGTWTSYAERSPSADICRVEARPLATIAEIVAASKANERLIGQTVLTGHGYTATLQYPLPYINYTPDERSFQADQGLVLFPDLSPPSDASAVYDRQSDPQMIVECSSEADLADDFVKLHHAYLLWNSFDEVEFAVKVPTEIGSPGGATTMHYSKVVKRASVNSVFSIDAGATSKL